MSEYADAAIWTVLSMFGAAVISIIPAFIVTVLIDIAYGLAVYVIFFIVLSIVFVTSKKKLGDT